MAASVQNLKSKIQNSSSGQALLELAIFGSLILLVLGVLVNYGLSADYNQQAKMESFRRALVRASDPDKRSANYVLIKDRHVPSPSHPFGLGQVVPISSSANILRDHAIQEIPLTASDLPTVTLNVNGAEQTFTAAGFRLEGYAPLPGQPSGSLVVGPPIGGQPPFLQFIPSNTPPVPEPTLERYRLIYGGSNVCARPACGGGHVQCLRYSDIPNPETNNFDCEEWSERVLIVDECEGQVIDIGKCLQQARMIASPSFCAQQCQKSREPGSPLDCAAVCNRPMNTPWYAQGCTAGGDCSGSPLRTAFANAKRLGVQPGYTKELTTDYTLQVAREDGGATTTTDSGGAHETTTRTVITAAAGQPATQSVQSDKEIALDATWQTQ